jgi:hypothetical protein
VWSSSLARGLKESRPCLSVFQGRFLEAHDGFALPVEKLQRRISWEPSLQVARSQIKFFRLNESVKNGFYANNGAPRSEADLRS